MLFNMRLPLTADKYGNHNTGLRAIRVDAEQRKFEVMIRKGGDLKSYWKMSIDWQNEDILGSHSVYSADRSQHSKEIAASTFKVGMWNSGAFLRNRIVSQPRGL